MPTLTSHLLTITPNFTIDHSLHLDHLMPGTVYRTDSSRRVPGGKGVNVARVVRSLGHAVEIGGFLGGINGTFAEQWFKEEGFIGHYVWGTGETRTTVIVHENNGRTTVINEVGMSVPPELVTGFVRQLHQISSKFTWISISGSIPPGASPIAYAELVEALRPAKIAVDSSGDALKAYVAVKPDLIRINGHEASALLGVPVDTIDQAVTACITLRDMGIPLVGISLGDLGAVGCNDQAAWHVTTPPVQVLSTVGAGDAMFGGMLAALMEGQSFEVALRQGVAAGAATCTTRDIGVLPRETYLNLLSHTDLIKLRSFV